ncbi:hypothetical protein AOQ84DRAFT_303827 [Glonium stellatum]|uniref:RNase H type-1 domain-containing protein n=1 Tax=Glonium stellatum TaxID=574774 RepID=A0A8E2JMT1_9PEZI|nr:hypothetical protein AOQ84DRAFT_303827 [Glonium stellatum]
MNTISKPENGSGKPPLENNKGENEQTYPVSVLSGPAARFIPQWDDQILGPSNAILLQKNHDNTPKPISPSSVMLYGCSECQLTWLVGAKGLSAATSHPSHRTYFHQDIETKRSIVTFMDGACYKNGYPNALIGVGAFFQENSRFNISEKMAIPDNQKITTQRAELYALIVLLRSVRIHVLPERQAKVTEVSILTDRSTIHDTVRFRLIVGTKSSYIVNALCAHSVNWELNSTGLLRNKRGFIIHNSSEFLQVQEEVQALADAGVQVQYYLVSRQNNTAADRLARLALKT